MSQNTNPKYSVITPFHIWSEKRRDDFERCLNSVFLTGYEDYEHVLVDDGSVMEYDIPEDGHTVVEHQPHLERVMAFNKAFSLAKGEWFVMLDSDDELQPDAFDIYDRAIAAHPDYNLFNFAVKFASKAGPDKDWIRGPFEPKVEGTGHETFGGGNVVNGSYIWSRAVYDDLGGFPDNCYDRDHPLHVGKNLHMTNPWDFSFRFQELYPETQPLFEVVNEDHPKGYPRELGNPWGQDYALFYQYTRKYHSLPIKEVTHVIHTR